MYFGKDKAKSVGAVYMTTNEQGEEEWNIKKSMKSRMQIDTDRVEKSLDVDKDMGNAILEP